MTTLDPVPLADGGRAVLVERPDGTLTRSLPLTVGNLYRVYGLDGSNVRMACDEEAIGEVSIARSRVRGVSAWARSDDNPQVWWCECDGVRFRAVRAGRGRRGWACKAFDGSAEFAANGTDRDAAIVELYAIVRAERERAEHARHYPGG